MAPPVPTPVDVQHNPAVDIVTSLGNPIYIFSFLALFRKIVNGANGLVAAGTMLFYIFEEKKLMDAG